MFVQIIQAFTDVSAPSPHHLELQWLTDSPDVGQERTSCHSLSDEANLLILLIDPCIYECDDSWMLQRFQHIDLLGDTLSLVLLQVLELDHIPCNLLSSVAVKT